MDGEKLYTVAIDKAYYPKEMHKGNLPWDNFQYMAKVKAVSRTEAAKKVWADKEVEWTKGMLPPNRLGRHVSLNVDMPGDPSQGLLGRLSPVRVAGTEIKSFINVNKSKIENDDDEWFQEWLRKNKKESGLNKKLVNVLTDSFTNGTMVVVVDDDPDLSLIVQKGKEFSISGRIYKKGKPCSCHKNVSELYYNDEIDGIATGYALTDDGGWRSHTWGIKDDNIVETTNKYLNYFGVILDKESSKKFLRSQGVGVVKKYGAKSEPVETVDKLKGILHLWKGKPCHLNISKMKPQYAQIVLLSHERCSVDYDDSKMKLDFDVGNVETVFRHFKGEDETIIDKPEKLLVIDFSKINSVFTTHPRTKIKFRVDMGADGIYEYNFIKSGVSGMNIISHNLKRIASVIYANKLVIPSGVKKTDRMEIAKAVIERANELGKIYNVDYKDLKDNVSRRFEESADGLKEVVEKIEGGRTKNWDEIYWMIPMGMNSLGKFEREIQRFKNVPVFVELKKFVDEWKPYLEAIKALKDKVVMGRKPNENPSENRPYQPPLHQVSTDVTKAVKDSLDKVVDNQYDQYVKEMKDMILNWAVGYVGDMEKTPTMRKDKRKYFRVEFGSDSFRMDVCQALTEDKEDQHGMYSPSDLISVKLKKDYDLLAQKMAVQQADALKDMFISKNLRKMVTVVSKKQLKNTEVKWGSLAGGTGFSGKITFNFDDGASFVVYNQAVTVWNTYRPFMRFPTTFHDVVFSDGTKKKMMSEQEMNEVWK